ncbi:MAG: NAD(P)/FAD-dependent oxidoreductase [Candidatus Eisenbacteria bacterium]
MNLPAGFGAWGGTWPFDPSLAEATALGRRGGIAVSRSRSKDAPAEAAFDTRRHHVVVIGGGFGGLFLVRSLRRAPVGITLLDRRNFHLFQPLLYQVATGGLSPANIAAPLRMVLKRQKNARVLLGEATGFDVKQGKVFLRTGVLTYDTLVIATGASHNYFGNDHWEEIAPGLKTIEDATEMRARILLAFEEAEREEDPGKARSLLTFAVIGAGPTGVELAGALAEIARDTVRKEFRRIDPAGARIFLLDAADRVLPSYPPELSEKARRSLEKLGVTVRTGAMVKHLEPEMVTVRAGDGEERIPAHTVLWAAGVQASPLGKAIADETGAELDRAGRVVVRPNLTVMDHPEIFVIGDLACFRHKGDEPLPGVAPVAMQQGRYVAGLIRARLREGQELPAFHYEDKGSMATIGRKHAVAMIKDLRFSGVTAWFLWLFVHLLSMVEFQNRVLVLLQWAWNYFTRNRAARLITQTALRPFRFRDRRH